MSCRDIFCDRDPGAANDAGEQSHASIKIGSPRTSLFSFVGNVLRAQGSEVDTVRSIEIIFADLDYSHLITPAKLH
jgi:hypothetical protein